MADDPISVSRRYLEALSARDVEAMCAELSDDVVFNLPVLQDPFPKRVEGQEAHDFVRNVIPTMWTDFRLVGIELRQEADPERVIAEFTSEGTMFNGNPYAQVYVFLLRVRDGKVVETKEFFDSLALATAMGAIPSPATVTG